MPFEIVYTDKPVSHHVHTHVYYEMLYVLQGEVVMTIQQRDYTVSAGSLVFLNQFDQHATRITCDTYKRYYLLLPPTQLKAFHNDVLLLSVFRLHGDNFPYVLAAGERKPHFDSYFAMLLDTARQGGAYADARVEALITLILTDAQALRPDMFIPASQLSFLPIQEILDRLDRTFAQRFSLSELAQEFHVSPGCLSSHFRHHVGMSPMQYVTSRRLNHARVLLLKTELPVLEIALLCGYSDTSNFVRRFRQQYGFTPLQFRNQHRDGVAARMASYITVGPGLEAETGPHAPR